MRRLLDQICEHNGIRPRILLVDDDPVSIGILTAIFEQRIDIASATSCHQAMDIVGNFRPDLILLDICLTDGSGFDLYHRLQDSSGTSAPIIFVTASNCDEDEVTAFQLGAVDFIRKPIAPYVAESRVITHLALQLQTRLLKQVANNDGLTGIKNRRIFDEELERQWKECARNLTPLSVIMADIDHFKEFNDHYGHLAGDACLRRIAGAIQATLNRPGDCAARYGGEEFACILPNTGLAGAQSVAEHIRRSIAGLNIPHQAAVTSQRTVSVSLGVATCFPQARSGWLDLLEAADRQLYRAKELGRNRACGIGLTKSMPVADVTVRRIEPNANRGAMRREPVS